MVDPANAAAHRLQQLLHACASRAPIQQVIMAVESGDGTFRWAGATGQTNGTPVGTDTPFFIASIDKLFNATIVMMLSESGRLDLDEPVCAYLSSELTRRLHHLGAQDHTGRITVRHLLSHTSGLADWLEDAPRGGRSLVDRILDEGDRAISMEEMIGVVRDRLTPHFPPQDLSSERPRIRYSNTNFELAVAIIETVTGQPLPQVHEQLLFGPVGMRNTYFAGRSDPAVPTPEPTALRARGVRLHLPLLMRSIRAIYATAADLIAFLRHLVRGELFQRTGTLASMQARWTRFGFPLDRAAVRAPSWPIEYGLGIMRFRLPRILTPLQAMPAVTGHSGSTGSWLFHCSELDMFLSGSVDEVTAGAVPYRAVPKMLSMLRSSTGKR